jgi:hypothetical protein
MKVHRVLLAVILSAGAILGFQQQAPEQRPTLGPQPAPSLGAAPSLQGPINAKTMNPAELRRVHLVYIAFIDNSLNLKLVQDLSSHSPFRVVTDRHQADAILRGDCFSLPHLKQVHSEVYLMDKKGQSIWQDIIRHPYNPPGLHVAVADSAQQIASDLIKSIEIARR